MQSFKGIVINLGKSGALPRCTSTSVSNALLGSGGCNRAGGILHHHLSTSNSSPQEGGGFFNSFFGGEKVELQHAPHKEVRRYLLHNNNDFDQGYYKTP